MVGETMKAYSIKITFFYYCWLQIGGGGGKPLHPQHFEFYNHKTMSFNRPQKVVEIESITKVPLECQCRSALSVLLKQADKVPKQNHYVQFPFGLMDVNSLRKLLAFYDRRSAQKQVQEEKKWLSIDVLSPHSEMFVPKSEMITFFSQIWNQKHANSEQVTCVRNLVGTRWLTDVILTYFANLINTTISNTLCFVLQHPSAMFSHKPLLDKMERISCGQEVVEKIIII